MDELPILLLLVLIPLVSGILIGSIRPHSQLTPLRLGVGVSCGLFFVFLLILSDFEPKEAGDQYAQHAVLVPWIGLHWAVGLDGISLWALGLTTLLVPLALVGCTSSIKTRLQHFVASMLILESALLGVLVAKDLLLFFLFWCLMLSALYILISRWGGDDRVEAKRAFWGFSLFATGLLLGATLYTGLTVGTFEYARLMQAVFSENEQLWLFTAFSASFLILIPVIPVHRWYPAAHTEAPGAASIVLTALVLKIGTYGMLRIAIPLFPEAMGSSSPILLLLCVGGMFYGAFRAYREQNLKTLVAYASISQLGLILLGVVTFNELAVQGAVLHMLSHGISVSALLVLLGMVQQRYGSLQLRELGGMASQFPGLTLALSLALVSMVGLPFTNGFVGEFMILTGAFHDGLPIDPQATTGVWDTLTSWPYLIVAATVLSAACALLAGAYVLRVLKRIYSSPVPDAPRPPGSDLNGRELLTIAPLIALIFAIGLFPGMFSGPIDTSLHATVTKSRPILSTTRDPERKKGRKVHSR